MKKNKLVINLLKKNKFIVLIMMIQIFIVLFLSTPSINEYKEKIGVFNYLKNSSMYNSIVYMNFPQCDILDKEKSNIKLLQENRDKVYKFYENNKNEFKSITPKKVEVTLSNEIDNNDYYFKVYDNETLKLLSQDVYIENYLNKMEYNGDFIPAMVQKGFSNRYKIDDKFEIKIQNKIIKFKIVGYFKDDITLPLHTIVANGKDFSVDELFYKEQLVESPFFIIQKNPVIRDISKNQKEIYLRPSILYLKENHSKNIIEKFEKFIKEENLGYYAISEDLFNAQIESYKYTFQRNFDQILAFFVMVILTILGVGYICRDKFEKRFYIYYLNGAKSKDIYILTFLFYFISITIPMLLHFILSNIVELDIVQMYLTRYSAFVSSAKARDYILHFREFIIIYAVLIVIIAIISYLPLRNRNSRYLNRRVR